jgi:hypothetical protein
MSRRRIDIRIDQSQIPDFRLFSIDVAKQPDVVSVSDDTGEI